MSFLQSKINIINQTSISMELEIRNETHTIANIILDELLKHPACTFAAYKTLNPLDKHFTLKYCVKENEDLKNTLLESIRNSLIVIKNMKEVFNN